MWKKICLIWNDFLHLFFPRLCLTCSKPLIEGEGQICLFCLCDLPTVSAVSTPENPAYRLFVGNKTLKEAAAAYLFERGGKIQQITHSFKYYGNQELAKEMGRLAAQRMKEQGLFETIDCIVPIPLHKKKKNKRGYNQSEWIAKGFAEVYEIPVYTQGVVRTRNSATQTDKDIYERHINASGMFEVVDLDRFVDRHVLLIDDVITAGATVQSCIDAMTNIAGLRISVFGLSITRQLQS